jgi:hypothetical protein
MNIPAMVLFLILLTFAGCSTYLMIERTTHTIIERRINDDGQGEDRSDDGAAEVDDEDNAGHGADEDKEGAEGN